MLQEYCTDFDHDALPSPNEYEEISWLKCKVDEYDCGFGSNTRCIPLTKVCDKRTDCDNGLDEGGMCEECSIHGCSHACQNYPDGESYSPLQPSSGRFVRFQAPDASAPAT